MFKSSTTYWSVTRRERVEQQFGSSSCPEPVMEENGERELGRLFEASAVVFLENVVDVCPQLYM